MRPDAPELERYLAAALAIADETRAIVLQALGRGFTHRRKADRSFVTEVDLAIEDRIRERLAESFPDHAVLGEERARRPGRSPFEWVIDPIDGTLSLRHRVPLYGTILALRHEGQTIVGLIDLPGLGRRYHAAAGSGAFRGLDRLHLAEPESVADEIVAIGDRRQFVAVDRLDVFERIVARHPCVRTYTDCFGHALAIEGSVGAMVDFGLHDWDVAATELLVTEAGGRYVEVDRRDVERSGATHDVVFGKPAVVTHVLEMLR
jgi:fructose-1,6-bisphosphatase/inositol monophosphatase family enzyme